MMPGRSRQHAGASGEVSRLKAPDAGGRGSWGVLGRVDRRDIADEDDAVELLADPGVAVRGGRVEVDPHPIVRHLGTREPALDVGRSAEVKGECEINNPLHRQLDTLKCPSG
jgi:hypothetical protein